MKDKAIAELHDFSRNSGYISFNGERYEASGAPTARHKEALAAAFSQSYSKAKVYNDVDINFMKWYYVADDKGNWTETNCNFHSLPKLPII